MSRIKSEAGTAAIEMAFASILLIPMLLGTIDFGRCYYHGVTVANAARAGASYGSLGVDKSNQVDLIKEYAAAEGANIGLTIDDVTVPPPWCECADGSLIECDDTCDEEGVGLPRQYMQVTVAKEYNTLFYYPGIPGSVNFSRDAIMRVQ